MSLSKKSSAYRFFYFIENKYVITYYAFWSSTGKAHKILVINLEDGVSHEMDIEYPIMSAAYLQNEFLIFGGLEISVWNVESLPFQKISHEENPAKFLIFLRDHSFASADKQTVLIWSYEMNNFNEMKILNKIETEHEITNLKALNNEKFLIVTKGISPIMSKLLICSCTTWDIVNEIDMMEHICNMFLTPDKVFLVLTVDQRIFFYLLNASYFYLEYKMEKHEVLLKKGFKELKNGIFGRIVESEQSVQLFKYHY